MAIFGVRTDNKLKAKRFVNDVSKRFKEGNLARNPFNAYVKIINKGGDPAELITVFKMVPIWPNFPPYIAVMSLISILIFGGHNNPGLLFIPLFFLGLGFFWTEDFFFITFRLGLRKAGYKGPIKKLKKKVLIDELARRM